MILQLGNWKTHQSSPKCFWRLFFLVFLVFLVVPTFPSFPERRLYRPFLAKNLADQQYEIKMRMRTMAVEQLPGLA